MVWPGLKPEYHDKLAHFMARVSLEGAEQALQLPGLSVAAEMVLSCKAGQLDRSLSCLTALSAGASDRAALNSFSQWHSRALGLPESCAFLSTQSPSEMGCRFRLTTYGRNGLSCFFKLLGRTQAGLAMPEQAKPECEISPP